MTLPRNYWYRRAVAALVLLVLLSIAGYFSGSGWLFDLTCHFRLHYLAAALLLLVVALAFKRVNCVVLALVVMLLNGYPVWQVVVSDSAEASKNLKKPVEWVVVQANIQAGNQGLDLFLHWLETCDADVVVVQELTDQGVESLEVLNEKYPYRVLRPDEGPFGMGVYSKYALTIDKGDYLEGIETFALPLNIQIGGSEITLIVAHPPPPITPELYRVRNRTLSQIASGIEGDSRSALVVGDLNTTRWSEPLTSLMKEAGLRDARQGKGLYSTWPAILGCAGLAIDHCLISDRFMVRQCEVGPNIGSDHLPLVVRLLFEAELLGSEFLESERLESK